MADMRDYMILVEKHLNAAERNDLPDSDFALPGRGRPAERIASKGHQPMNYLYEVKDLKMLIQETVDLIVARAQKAGLSVRVEQSGLSNSAYVIVQRADRRFFDDAMGKSARRRFCAETGFSFPRMPADFKIRISDHAEIDGSATHGANHADIVVSRDNLQDMLARLTIALRLLAQ